jgi:hypothetical protein
MVRGAQPGITFPLLPNTQVQRCFLRQAQSSTFSTRTAGWIAPRLRALTRRNTVSPLLLIASRFKSRSPSNLPNQIGVKTFTNDLLASIKSRQEELDGKRPVLTSYAMRMPVGIKRQLKRVAKKTGYTETDIVLELLRKALPVILEEEGIQEKLELV